MMRSLCIVFCFLLSIIGHSQECDNIILNDGTEISAVVKDVGLTEITYKKCDFQDGPTYKIARSSVFLIKYKNGEKDIFKKEKAIVNNETQYKKKPIHKDPPPPYIYKSGIGISFGNGFYRMRRTYYNYSPYSSYYPYEQSAYNLDFTFSLNGKYLLNPANSKYCLGIKANFIEINWWFGDGFIAPMNFGFTNLFKLKDNKAIEIEFDAGYATRHRNSSNMKNGLRCSIDLNLRVSGWSFGIQGLYYTLRSPVVMEEYEVSGLGANIRIGYNWGLFNFKKK